MVKPSILNGINIDLLDPKLHPINTKRYILSTPPVNEVIQNISACIDKKDTGAIIYGRPRLGKTFALRALKVYLQDGYGDIPIFTINQTWQQYAREKRFYEDLLASSGHDLISKGNSDEKRRRLINHLSNEIDKSQKGMMVLFIDEAQHLLEPHYYWLMDIYNALESKGYYVFYLLVGQKELRHRRSTFIEQERQQIVGRFMVREYAFSGIRTEEDIKELLEGYDELTEYPEGSNISFTNYFFPEAFSTGHRISTFSEKMFNIFTNKRIEVKLSGKPEIPMKYLTSTIEYLFKEYGLHSKKPSEWINHSMLEESIRQSGYIQAELGLQG
ncbi:AAA family ATPase [Desulforamulus aeronauticus]|uniref:Type II secretory pathway, component ExeA (Predicted ATPase) n=1 Tax=Desulforamulus aeronauticus DSM 10349 TaxID=1121421 RepID=A0A1M6W9P7_9FIRM|nr:AAA family ATPase [Desulforamulus aeronauticus]MCL4416611.1 AAA family ATPase [Actinomycetota bacterium]SHK70324.1 Type II secretory pathway, component ExeA (predicted ATPase) [Desulforamulus aeronauticus DSM 10349]SHK90451.1 Type II secretory pathway, component ExeA (predicted ATPase) [Desulforamulus aeronauticus DSM 10349]SHL00188.1 Type II secretory pathway, component ExeA (predicted ATPase) [Desulforamulus aeronauticus DSM 10349]